MLRTKNCEVCGVSFGCSTSDCWCNELPMIMSLEDGGQCLCPFCLEAKVKESVQSFVKDFQAGKVDNIAPKYRKAGEQLREGLDFYIEGGFHVFTEWYHLKRGKCCGNGCRHCPYGRKKK